MPNITCGSCKGTHNSVAEVKACYGITTERVKAAMANHPSARVVNHVTTGTMPATANIGTPRTSVVEALHFVQPGYYTIVFDEAADDRITLRVRDHWDEAGKARGEMVVDYLSGSENTRDYTGFAFLTPHGHSAMWSIWKRFRNNGRLARALEVLHQDPEEAGMAYALRSGNCYRCGRTLTVPASVHRGLGPVCAEKL